METVSNLDNKKLAYLIGAVVGDGHYAPPDKWGSYRFYFGSSDKDFALRIKQLIKELFSLNTGFVIYNLSKKNKFWRDHYQITSRPLPKLLMAYLPNSNKIPKFIRNSNIGVRVEFLSGFFDAEWGVSISKIKSRNAIDRRLYCHNADLEILEEIGSYLRDLDIDSFIQNGKGAYALNIWGYKNLVNFKNLIDFQIKRKKDKLTKAIQSYKLIRKEHRYLRINFP